LPFVVGVNTFNGQLSYSLDEVRWALAVRDDIPVISFDARFRGSVRDALLVVLDHGRDDHVLATARHPALISDRRLCRLACHLRGQAKRMPRAG
jgi:hypothetical protein